MGLCPVYDNEQWKLHVKHNCHFPGPLACIGVVRSILWPLLYSTLMAVVVGLYHDLVQERAGWLPHLPDHAGLATILNVTSFALALLLTFRTNACYGRWWEARTLWGNQLNTSRNLIRQALTWPETSNYGLQKCMCRWITALPVCHKAFLRGEGNLKEQLKSILFPTEQQWVMQCEHGPNACTLILSSLCKQLELPLYRSVEVDRNLTQLINIYGGCERIMKTPVPLSYTRHTSQFLMIWLTFVPLGLWSVCEWFTPIVCCIVAFLLLGIANIGIQIEQPFKVLPLDSMCAGVKKSVTEAYRQHLTVQDLAADAMLNQQNGCPDEIADSCLHLQKDLFIPSIPTIGPPNLRSVSSGSESQSADNYERMKVRRFSVKLGDCQARKLHSLPVGNHISTQDVLPDGQRQASSTSIASEVVPKC